MLERINKALRRVPTWTVYLLGLLPLVWIVWLTLTNSYGPDPVKGIEHGLGLWAIRLLLLALLVTPLRWLGLNLLKFRRQIGLVGFAYVVLPLPAWISIVGMVALVLLIPLAVTSNNRAIRWMGALRWNRLHKLAYLATILAMVHFLMIGKVYTTEVLVYSAILVLLLCARVWRNGPVRLIWA